MGLSRPSDYPDRNLVWFDYFNGKRSREVEGLLTDEVVAEHAANPSGYRSFHSWKLQRVLNYLRQQPILGKYAVYAERPWEEYRIAIVQERGRPAKILEEPVFRTEDEAAHGVFVRRVDELRASRDRRGER